MSKEQIDTFLLCHGKNFSTDVIPLIRQTLEALPGESASMFMVMDFRNTTGMLLLSLFVGRFGIDRFLVEDVALGVLKLITGGGLGIWCIVDLFLIRKRARRYNYDLFMKTAVLARTINY